MPDILIRGMEMPERSDVIVQIFPDRKATLYPFLGEPRAVEVIELPEHGDLIDRSELKTNMIDDTFGSAARYVNLVQILDAPAIVPSNREETE